MKRNILTRLLPGIFAFTLLFSFAELKTNEFGSDFIQYDSLNWSRPQLIFEDPNGHVGENYLFSDSSGAAHLFWAYNPRRADSDLFQAADTYIFYLLLQEGNFIGNAVDVLDYEKAIIPFSLAWDTEGNVFVATQSGYSRCLNLLIAPINNLGNAKAWNKPTCLLSQGISSPSITIAPDGVIYIIYIKEDQSSIAIIKSINQGRDWSSPITIYATSNGDTFLNEVKAIADERGRIHVTWSEVKAPTGYPPTNLEYAQSSDGGLSWSTPFELASADQAEQNLAIHKDNVYVIWNGDAALKGRYFRMSKDGGKTWFDQETLPLDHETGGLQGAPAIVVDNLGIVHVLYSDSENLYYNSFNNGVWGNLELIAGPQNIKVKGEIESPYLAITGGNQLHALFTGDWERIYYLEKHISAQPEAPIPFIQPAPTSTIAARQATQKPEMQIDQEKLQNLPSERGIKNSQSMILIIALLPVSILILLVLLGNKRAGR